MPDYSLRHIQLFQELFLVFRKAFPSNIQRLIHPRDTTESNDRARDSLVEPRERNMAHLPFLSLCHLLDTTDDLLVNLVLGRLEKGRHLLLAC